MDESLPQLPSTLDRLAESAKAVATNPELRHRALGTLSAIGQDALLGAGLIKEQGDGTIKVRKLGIAKAILRPGHTARRALKAAGKSASNEARDTSLGVARSAAGKVFNHDAAVANSESYDLFANLPSLSSSTSSQESDPFADLPSLPKADPRSANLFSEGLDDLPPLPKH